MTTDQWLCEQAGIEEFPYPDQWQDTLDILGEDILRSIAEHCVAYSELKGYALINHVLYQIDRRLRVHICAYDTPNCEGRLWQCRTCKRWFCEFHWYESQLGICVECPACARDRQGAIPEEYETEWEHAIEKAFPAWNGGR